jgi:hypothetical protein
MIKIDVKKSIIYTFSLAAMTYASLQLTPTVSASVGICCEFGNQCPALQPCCIQASQCPDPNNKHGYCLDKCT